MNRALHPFAVGIVVVALNLAGGACSSSKPLTSTRDAAAPDLGAEVQARRDVAPDVAGPDLVEPDLPVPQIPDVPLASKDVALPDLFDVTDAVNLADLPIFKDSVLADLSGPQDSVIADLPTAPTDAIPNDGVVRDTPLADLALPDAASERWRVCTPGADQTCNDNPAVSSIWGTCLPDGTCACSAGKVINPINGRCTMTPAADASTGGEAGQAAVCTGEYTACGCGCCGGELVRTKCYYASLGETIAAITADDLAVRTTSNCDLAGCSVGTRYLCCAPPAPGPSSNSTYVGTGYSGGLDHVTIAKSGTDCATLSFAKPMSSANSALRITTPASWSVVGGTFGSCADAGARDVVSGAVGSFALRASGSLCLADLHATLFAFTVAGAVKTSALDVDGLTVTGLPAGLCK